MRPITVGVGDDNAMCANTHVASYLATVDDAFIVNLLLVICLPDECSRQSMGQKTKGQAVLLTAACS